MIDNHATGMLLFPFGNLSHASILYYTILYVMVVFESTAYAAGVTVLHKVLSGYLSMVVYRACGKSKR